jgi:cytochrome c
MLRHVGILIGVLLFLSCFSKRKSQSNGLVIAATAIDTTSALEMISTSDCLTCHRTETRSIGPAFQYVSRKYKATEANIEKLVRKIKTGGSGVWGNIPMTPHPNQSLDSIRVMVKYILSLKNQKN